MGSKGQKRKVTNVGKKLTFCLLSLGVFISEGENLIMKVARENYPLFVPKMLLTKYFFKCYKKTELYNKHLSTLTFY